MSTVMYQPFDGSDGLQPQEADLVAWRDGQEVARCALPAEEDMQSLLWSFRAAELLPEVSFSITPDEIISDLELDLLRIYEGTLVGSGNFVEGSLKGLAFRWRAEYSQGDVFMFSGPEGARPWSEGEERGFGWQIFLPEKMCQEHDFVFLQRVALAIESFLYALAAKEEISIPYRCRISNQFSLDNPTWRVGPPQVIPF